MTFDYLKPVFFIEIITILVVSWGILLTLLFRQRILLRKLLSKLVEHRRESSVQTSDLDAYFERVLADTSQRYENLTQLKTVLLNLESNYSEKVAAFRYLYLEVEREAEQFRKMNLLTWDFFEKRFEALLNGLQKKVTPDEKLMLSHLESYRVESKEIIDRLKEIVVDLKNSFHQSNQIDTDDNLRNVLYSIAENTKLHQFRDIFEELKNLSQQWKLNSNSLEKSVASLEYEVETCDKYLLDIRSNPDQSPIDVNEIKRLRNSNRVQRQTIGVLEDEIRILQDSLGTSLTPEEREKNEQQIHKLERAVKEYEGCVIILEEQINHLYDQLEQRKNISEENKIISNEKIFNEFNEEFGSVVSSMNRTAESLHYSKAVNEMSSIFLNCKTINEMSQKMIELMNNLGISAGFIIQSKIGKEIHFSAPELKGLLQEKVQSHKATDHFLEIQENYFFLESRIKMILPSSHAYPDDVKTAFSGLVCLVNANILRLEHAYLTKQYQKEMTDWKNQIKGKITTLDVQYTYQVEEGKRIFDELMSQLEQSLNLLDSEDNRVKMVLKDAVEQYKARFELSVLYTEAIEREFLSLDNHIGGLEVHSQ